MNICIFTENHYRGGVDTFLVNLIENWPDRRDIITICCNRNHPSIGLFKNIIRDNLNFYLYDYIITKEWLVGKNHLAIKKPNLFYFIFKIFRKFFFIFSIPHYLFRLFFFFKNKEFETFIVVNGGFPGSLLCRLSTIVVSLFLNKSVIHNFHSHAQKIVNKLNLIERIIDKLILNKKVFFISVSKSCIFSLETRFNSKLEQISFIPNGINDPLLNNKKRKYNYEAKYILMLSSLHKYKGHNYLLESFKIINKKYPKLKLLMYGDGSEFDRIRIINKINELNLNSVAELFSFKTNIDELISKSFLVVLPSQNFESFGYVLIEAMARNKPVVATKIGGIPEVFESGRHGYICDPNNYHEFAQAIINLLNDSQLYKNMVKSGRQLFLQKYLADKMSLEYYKVLKSIN